MIVHCDEVFIVLPSLLTGVLIMNLFNESEQRKLKAQLFEATDKLIACTEVLCMHVLHDLLLFMEVLNDLLSCIAGIT